MLSNSVILDLFRETILLVISVSLPIVIAAAGIGVLVSLVQALTQVQEQTLPFAFKLMAVFVATFAIYETAVVDFNRFTARIFDTIQMTAVNGGGNGSGGSGR